ncbi:MAG TPA: glucose-6-phosphate dehydrogenase assembly protein OpcA [Micromonosporaceae bacterium]|jgi:glucose-6-phosphate dehydrogenase assembly protein OpcA|nr:glucose-6-phosphate dehydrogenase assembly protein OpcA [Micromonosporaceae bacterium]
MLALWDTTGTDVVRKLAAERRSAGGVASGLALTLIAVAEEPQIRAVEDAVTIAAAEHPCRLLVVSRDPLGGRADAPSKLDAEIVVGGRLGPCEAVVLRMSGRLALHAESVVMPLLAPDVPVVTWWHGEPPDRIAYDPLGVVAERRITDVAVCPDPISALRQRANDYAPGDTDLAWTRITPWRTLIAGAFDTISAPVTAVHVVASADDPTAALLGGWLQARLGVAPTAVPAEDGLQAVRIELSGGTEFALTRRNGRATMHCTGFEDRTLPLVPRRLGDELAEELRRLDADQPYAAALAAATGAAGLNDRPATRVHVWHDPALAERPEAAAL